MNTSRIRILSGPSQGRTIDLPDTDDLIHLGRSLDNEIVVEDPALMPRHASFVRRHGRYAVYVFEGDDVRLDDRPLPPQQWIWLPAVARLRLTNATTIVLEAAGTPEAEFPETPSAAVASRSAAPQSPLPAPATAATTDSDGHRPENGNAALPAAVDRSAVATPPDRSVAGTPPTVASGISYPDAAQHAPDHASAGSAAEHPPDTQPTEVAARPTDTASAPAIGETGDRPTAGRTDAPPSTETPAAASRQPPSQGRDVPRFVADRQPAHVIRLGEDGRLPELHLATESEDVARRTGWSGSSALLYFVLALSMISSTALLLVDAPNPAATADRQIQVRRALRRFYETSDELQPYQKLLLEAALAHERGDHRAEREAYLKVLALLNAEDKNPFIGLTGRLSDDAELRRLITAALQE